MSNNLGKFHPKEIWDHVQVLTNDDVFGVIAEASLQIKKLLLSMLKYDIKN